MTRHLQLVAFLWKHRQGAGEQIANPAYIILAGLFFLSGLRVQEVPFRKSFYCSPTKSAVRSSQIFVNYEEIICSKGKQHLSCW